MLLGIEACAGRNQIIISYPDTYDEKEQIFPLDFYNQVVIATHLEPMLVTITNITLAINGKEPNFPEEVDINWLKGWDKGGII